MRILIIIQFLIIQIFNVSAAAQPELWEFWDSGNENSTELIRHDEWQNILNKYRFINSNDNTARISYKKIIKDKAYKDIDDYISRLEKIPVRNYKRDEQFAYWVNLYNAATVRLILDNYPLTSIRKISKPWSGKILTVENQELSLDDIEHRILRPIWKDPRIHFVVNCASIGCPDLPSEALTAFNKNRILEFSASNFINSEKGFSERGKVLVLSSIFKWYQQDFGEDEKQMLSYLSRYRSFKEAESGEKKKLKIKYAYNWNLNE